MQRPRIMEGRNMTDFTEPLDGLAVTHGDNPTDRRDAGDASQRSSRPIWSEDDIARLRELWTAGLSATQIAMDIGGTRSRVLGKVHRLGLDHRKPPKLVIRHFPLRDLRNDACRWPIGDPKEADFHYCGKRPVSTNKDGKTRPYCKEHALMAYLLPTPRR